MTPAVVAGTKNSWQINREEMFAPIACVIKVDSYEEAVDVVNDTHFGLTSGIITKSLARATDFRRRVQTGVVTINLPTAGTDYHVPFGGRGSSSYGPREQGRYAEEFYTTVKQAILPQANRTETMHIIDNLQYANWSEKIFKQMREGGVDAVHVTIAYHEIFREMVANIEQWNCWFETFPQLICHGRSGDDVRRAKKDGRTAIIFGFQNPSPIEDDIGLVEICHMLGVRFMQLTYNNQSLLATGCYETEDSGVTRMGREVIKEMNRVGLVVDMSHSAERSTLDAISLSERPIAITHANPNFWHPAKRNKSDEVLRALVKAAACWVFVVPASFKR